VVYVAISIAVVNVLAVVVVARLGRRLSGTTDQPRLDRLPVEATPARVYQRRALSAPSRTDGETNETPPRRDHERRLARRSASLVREV
jgi:hypothetical protein